RARRADASGERRRVDGRAGAGVGRGRIGNISTMAVLSAPRPYDRTVGRLGWNVAGVAGAVRAGC
ncbi:hypothetical protein, partial [Streptomyces sp. NPDC059744]|uniref:hypothetical protein n=1 Tax=Streptomyces sp. NPDC059744 TaxID=3346929 RepID=UPI00365B1568